MAATTAAETSVAEALPPLASPPARMFAPVTGTARLEIVGPTTSQAAPAASSAVPLKKTPPPELTTATCPE